MQFVYLIFMQYGMDGLSLEETKYSAYEIRGVYSSLEKADSECERLNSLSEDPGVRFYVELRVVA